MAGQRFNTVTQLGLAVFISLGVFAGGMAIARAAATPAYSAATGATAVDLPTSTDLTEGDSPEAPAAAAVESASKGAAPTTPAVFELEPTPKAAPEVDADDIDDPRVDCVWTPSADDLTQNAREVEGLARTLDGYGIAFERNTDQLGFAWLEWGADSTVVDAVVSSYYEGFDWGPELAFDDVDLDAMAFDEGCWAEGHYYEPTEEELAEQDEFNAALMTALDEAGVGYALIVDEPWVWVEYDFDDTLARTAADAVYEQFYGPFDDFVECDPHADAGNWEDTTAARTATLEALAADLALAGVDVTFEVEFDWAWLVFDLDDNEAVDVVVSALEAELSGAAIELV